MKVIILCGGQGTRLREETEFKPKPMVEIGGKPILWHIMKQYSHYGYKEFILALGYKGDVIRDYFINYKFYNNDFTINLGNESNVIFHTNNDEKEWKVTLVETGADSMTGYRTKLCEKYVCEDDFMLTYGDAVSDVNIKSLVEFHKKQKTIGTITGVFPPSRFGELIVKGDYVFKFKEKKIDVENQTPINGGFFIFKKDFFSLLDNNKDLVLETEPMEKLIDKKQLSVYRHYGFWQCMDTFRDNQLLNSLWQNNPEWKVWE
ncbi:MAG: glucose-1-phosphate cytidylyltransferase [Ignavibacteriae bacterium]|nr:glucose-1-phosphate cytidylyltransferase [Ignavibacteriota bacterium]